MQFTNILVVVVLISTWNLVSSAQWSQWSTFSPCTQPCDTGSQFRTRTCEDDFNSELSNEDDFPDPVFNTKSSCEGCFIEYYLCNVQPCNTSTSCSYVFQSWSSCSIGDYCAGTQTRTATCVCGSISVKKRDVDDIESVVPQPLPLPVPVPVPGPAPAPVPTHHHHFPHHHPHHPRHHRHPSQPLPLLVPEPAQAPSSLVCSGPPPLEVKSCGSDCCFREWSDWSICDKPCGQRYRRQLCLCGNETADGCYVSGYNDSRCTGVPLTEVANCTSPVCQGCQFQFLNNWSQCSACCGGGIQYQKQVCVCNNQVFNDSYCYSLPPAVETRICNTAPCCFWSANATIGPICPPVTNPNRVCVHPYMKYSCLCPIGGSLVVSNDLLCPLEPTRTSTFPYVILDGSYCINYTTPIGGITPILQQNCTVHTLNGTCVSFTLNYSPFLGEQGLETVTNLRLSTGCSSCYDTYSNFSCCSGNCSTGGTQYRYQTISSITNSTFCDLPPKVQYQNCTVPGCCPYCSTPGCSFTSPCNNTNPCDFSYQYTEPVCTCSDPTLCGVPTILVSLCNPDEGPQTCCTFTGATSSSSCNASCDGYYWSTPRCSCPEGIDSPCDISSCAGVPISTILPCKNSKCPAPSPAPAPTPIQLPSPAPSCLLQVVETSTCVGKCDDIKGDEGDKMGDEGDNNIGDNVPMGDKDDNNIGDNVPMGDEGDNNIGDNVPMGDEGDNNIGDNVPMGDKDDNIGNNDPMGDEDDNQMDDEPNGRRSIFEQAKENNENIKSNVGYKILTSACFCNGVQSIPSACGTNSPILEVVTCKLNCSCVKRNSNKKRTDEVTGSQTTSTTLVSPTVSTSSFHLIGILAVLAVGIIVSIAMRSVSPFFYKKPDSDKGQVV